ncbi:unnamed protein product [Litomosoides sigmodontis]|uniref:Uncharacterized protein n=1 Tax=Litomosoides sigmodontis TaxID=42156 RepID=A0A3P6SPP7_LITSI|nr:unnamed protein product [Litomosoides sigmodontis]
MRCSRGQLTGRGYSSVDHYSISLLQIIVSLVSSIGHHDINCDLNLEIFGHYKRNCFIEHVYVHTSCIVSD